MEIPFRFITQGLVLVHHNLFSCHLVDAKKIQAQGNLREEKQDYGSLDCLSVDMT